MITPTEQYKGRIRSVLIVRGAFGDMYEPAWLRALNEVGVATKMFDCHAKTQAGIIGRIERRILIGPSIRKIRCELIEQVRSEKPDVVLLYQGHYIDRATLRSIKQYSHITGYHNDDPFGPGRTMRRYIHFHSSLDLYDSFHVYRPQNLDDIRLVGVKNCAVLMPGFLPWIDTPPENDQTNQSQYASDVFFAGHFESDIREECLMRAVDAGLKVRVHGDPISWHQARPALRHALGHIQPIQGLAYRRGITAAAMALCFFSKKNRDQYTRRVFEITATGGFLLSERTPAMLQLFPEGHSAEYFESPEEFIDKVRHYLKHPEQREKIARNGREQAIRCRHDLHSRMLDWLMNIELWTAKPALT